MSHAVDEPGAVERLLVEDLAEIGGDLVVVLPVLDMLLDILVHVDGLGVGDVGNIVLKDRQHLSQDGLIIVVIAMDGKTGQILAGPDIISRGFVYVRESEDLMDSIKRQICKDISNMESEGIKDWTTIKTRVKDTLHDFVYSKTKRNPMIIPIISEI